MMAHHILRNTFRQHVNPTGARLLLDLQNLRHLLGGDFVQILVVRLGTEQFVEPGAAHHNGEQRFARLREAATVEYHTQDGTLLGGRHEKAKGFVFEEIVSIVLEIDDNDVNVWDGG